MYVQKVGVEKGYNLSLFLLYSLYPLSSIDAFIKVYGYQNLTSG